MLAGGRPDGSLLRLAEGAAGNPLYLTELVAALMRGSNLTLTPAGTAALADGTDLGGQPGSPGPGSIPGSLSAVIADRLGFVTGPVRDVLRAAALLGVDFEISDLVIVLGRGLPELLPAVDEARVAGVLAESGSSLGFRHPMIRAALYEEMPAAVRAAWHRDAARALAAAGAPPERVARQLLRAADGSGPAEVVDERMLDWLVRTADQLLGQAPGVAAELLAQAVASTPFGADHHDWLVSRLADALYRTGDIVRAAQVANQALDFVTEPDLLVDLHWTLAQCRIRTGQSAESLATLDRALETPGLSVTHRARLLVVAARTHSSFGEHETAGQVAPHRASSGGGGERRLGHGLGAARAVAGDGDTGPAGRVSPAVRSGADRNPGRSGAGGPEAPAADQQGRHAGQPGPVRGGRGRGRGGAEPRGPGRHGYPAGSGALRPGAVPLRDGALGRRAGRDRKTAGEPAGAGRGEL